MAMDTEQIGSVGHLVGASLETAGHYMQSLILDLLNDGLGYKLAVLILVVGALASLMKFALQGDFKGGVWYLIGPAIFFTMLTQRVDSSGATWQYGVRDYKTEYVFEATRGVAAEVYGADAPDERQASISWFFATWNRVISSTVQTFVSLVDFVAAKSDMRFMTESDRYFALFKMAPQDARIVQFLNIATLNKCGTYYIQLKEYYKNEQNQRYREEIERTLKLTGAEKKVTYDDYRRLIDWLKSSGLWDDSLIPGRTVERREAISCDELWTISVNVLKRHYTVLLEWLVDVDLPEGMDKAQLREDLMKKFGTQKVHENYTEVIDGNQQLIWLINEGASRMLLRSLKNASPNLAQIEYGRDIAYQDGEMVTTADGAAKALRVLQKTDAWEEKGDYFIAMLSLPYIQGMMLYFLAVTFPFFAFTMILPGKHGGILLWMGLWAWVKTWDFGFAIVMLVDRILYELLPHGAPITDAVKADPAQTIKSLLEVDPTYSEHMYYNLLATCMAAVPILTGFAVKKGGGEIMGLVSHSLTNFAGRIGTAMAAYNRNLKAESNFFQFGRDMTEVANRAMAKALQSDPIIHAALAGKMLSEVGANVGSFTHIPGLAKYSDAAKKAAQAGTAHWKAIFDARMKELVSVATYNESVLEHSRRGAQEAIRLKYNSHDFMGPNFYGEDVLNRIIAVNTFPVHGVGGSIMDSSTTAVLNPQASELFNTVLGVGGVLGVPALVSGFKADGGGDLGKPKTGGR